MFQNLGNSPPDVSSSSGGFGKGSKAISETLVLDSERGELVKAPSGAFGKKSVAAAGANKTPAALKSHSEAERRRRERINARLTTLHDLVPSSSKDKMEKATLLSSVINQVKELKKSAVEASKGLLIPTDSDEVRVEPLYEEATGEGQCHATFHLIKASLCCEYRPELLPELRRTLDALQLVNVVKAEISTLGNRMKTVLFLFCYRKDEADDEGEALHHLLVMRSVQQALCSVMEKVSVPVEYSSRRMPPFKRQRLSYFDSASSS